MISQWMTALKTDFAPGIKKDEEQTFLSGRSIAKPDSGLVYEARTLPGHIPASRRAKSYREAVVAGANGCSTFSDLADLLPPACIISGYTRIDTETGKAGPRTIKALVDDDKRLLLLLSAMHPKQLGKLEKQQSAKKQAIRKGKSLDAINTIKLRIQATCLAGQNEAVLRAIQLFRQEPGLNPKPFLYPLYVDHTTAPATIARLVRNTLELYAEKYLIPVLTTGNPHTQAVLDLYLALQLNQDEPAALQEFRQLTQTRLAELPNPSQVEEVSALRENIGITYEQDGNTDQHIAFSISEHQRCVAELEEQIRHLELERDALKQSFNTTKTRLLRYIQQVQKLPAPQQQKRHLIIQRQARAEAVCVSKNQRIANLQREIEQAKQAYAQLKLLSPSVVALIPV